MDRELRTDSDRARRKELLSVKFERDALAAVLDYFPIGIVILDGENQPLQMNRVARKLLRDTSGTSGSRERAGGGPSMKQLKGIIQDLVGTDDGQPVRIHKLAGRKKSMKNAYEMLLVSLEEEGAESSGPTVIFLCDPTQEKISDPKILQATYDFTRTEAVVAAKLVDGLSIEEIADDLGVEPSTARSHLKKIFAKTGTHRQPDLVRLLMQGLSRLSVK